MSRQTVAELVGEKDRMEKAEIAILELLEQYKLSPSAGVAVLEHTKYLIMKALA